MRGSFLGGTYQFAMYYTASPNCLEDNKIGVAFSNDGIQWTRWPNNPIIWSAANNCADKSIVCPALRGLGPFSYGAGQAQLHNWNGSSGVRIWYTDTLGSGGLGIYERVSTDGVTFAEAPVKLSSKGISALMTSAAIAFNPTATELYLAAYAPATRGVHLYKIATGDRVDGTWTFLGEVPPSTFGQPDVFEPGFRTDVYGNLSPTTFPRIFMGVAFGKLKDHSPTDPLQWDMGQVSGQ